MLKLRNFVSSILFSLTIRQKYRDPLIITIISIILTLIWFHRGLPIAYAESGLWMYNSMRHLYLTSHIWWDAFTTGIPWPRANAGLPFYLFMSLLELIGLSPLAKEAFLFFLMLAMSGFSMYYLVRVLQNKDDNGSDTKAIVSGLFYMLNPFAMIYVWNSFLLSAILTYPFLPLILALFIKGLATGKKLYAFLIALILTFSQFVVIFPAIIPLLLFSYFVFHVAQRHTSTDIIKSLKFMTLTVVLWVFLNIWFIIPTLLDLHYAWGGFWIPVYPIFSFINPADSFRLTFYFASNDVVWPFYSSGIGSLFGFVLPLMSFSAVILKPKDIKVLFFSCLALIGFLFSFIATIPSLKELITHITLSYPLLNPFINSLVSQKALLLTTLSYAYLLGIFIYEVSKYKVAVLKVGHLGSKYIVCEMSLKTIALMLFFLMLSVYVWPMWTGYVFTHPDNPDVFSYTDVPSYYLEARYWIAKDGTDFRILSLPLIYTGVTYNWTPSYVGAYPDFQLFDNSIIGSREWNHPLSQSIIEKIPQLMSSTDEFWKVLSILNVKYIMLHNDINYKLRGVESPATIKELFKIVYVPGNVTTRIDCENITGWTAWFPGIKFNLEVDHSQLIQGNGSIRVDFEIQGGGNALAVYWFPKSYDWSDIKFLSFWIKTSKLKFAGVAIFVFTMETNFNNQYEYYLYVNEEKLKEWQHISINLQSYNQRYGSPSLSNVTGIGIGLWNVRPSNGSLWIDDIKIDAGIPKKLKHINYDNSIGKLEFYKIDENYFLPRIYGTSNYIVGKDIHDFLYNIMPDPQYDPRFSVIILEDQLDLTTQGILKIFDLDPNYKPEISFRQINPSKWIIQIKTDKPFILVFSESYDRRWKAYYGDVNWLNVFFAESVPEKYHFIVNGYANAWYLDKVGNYIITLYFQPQAYMDLGFVVSLLTFLSCVLAILLSTVVMKIKNITQKQRIKSRNN